ncbi:glycerophosphodiester phosphodiesterase, partial [Streptomyces sp. SID161]|nr:glycerophosphodiester phosphodiesterase [Streptomyces sp. SID161]
MGSDQADGRSQETGRRALLGAAVLGAGGAVLGLPGAARAADARTAGRAGRGLKSLPVPTIIGHRGTSGYRPEHTFG